MLTLEKIDAGIARETQRIDSANAALVALHEERLRLSGCRAETEAAEQVVRHTLDRLAKEKSTLAEETAMDQGPAENSESTVDSGQKRQPNKNAPADRIADIDAELDECRAEYARLQSIHHRIERELDDNRKQIASRYSEIRTTFSDFLAICDDIDQLMFAEVNGEMQIGSGEEDSRAGAKDPQDDKTCGAHANDDFSGYERASLFFSPDASDMPAQKGRLTETTHIRINSDELEYRIQALIEHLTARRISEEMDTPTYLFRLQEFLTRAAKRSSDMRKRPIKNLIDALPDQGRNAQDRYKRMSSTAQTVSWPELDSDRRKLQSHLDEMRSKTEVCFTSLTTAVEEVHRRLKSFEHEICGRDAHHKIRRIASFVSKEIENATLVRAGPFVTAVVTTLGVKAALNLQTSLFLPGYNSVIYLCVFAVAYWGALIFGRRFRVSIMQSIYDRARSRIYDLLSDADDKLLERGFEFRPISMQRLNDQRASQFEGFPEKSDVVSLPRLRMAASNIGMAFVPAPLLATAFFIADGSSEFSDRLAEFDIFRTPDTVAFYGRNGAGQTCVIRKGHSVHSDDTYEYVLPPGTKRNTLGLVFFPERYAEAIPKTSIYRTVPVRAAPEPANSGGAMTAQAKLQQISVVDAVPAPGPDERPRDHFPEIPSCDAPPTSPDPSVLVFNTAFPAFRNTGGGDGAAGSEIDELTSDVGTLFKNQTRIYRALFDLTGTNARFEQVQRSLRSEVDKLTFNSGLPLPPSKLLEQWVASNNTLAERIGELHEPDTIVMTVIVPGIAEPMHNVADKALFSFSVNLNEQPIFQGKNVLLLPFYPHQVTKIFGEPARAYEHGRNISLMDDPKQLRATNGIRSGTYLHRLAEVLRSTLEAAAPGESIHRSVTLDVMGFASEKWDVNPGGRQTKIDNLNHALGEGRRAAILDFLSKELNGVSHRIGISGEDGNGSFCLSDWDPAKRTISRQRFSEPAIMKRERNRWISGIDDAGAAMTEFLNRSVLVVIDVGGEECGNNRHVDLSPAGKGRE